MDFNVILNNLSADLAATTTILSTLLLAMPAKWDENVKKIVTFVACLIATVFTAYSHGYLSFDYKDIGLDLGYLYVLVIATNNIYDKMYKPVLAKLSQKTNFKLLRKYEANNS